MNALKAFLNSVTASVVLRRYSGFRAASMLLIVSRAWQIVARVGAEPAELTEQATEYGSAAEQRRRRAGHFFFGAV
jgi:hypothetical protein